MKLKPTAILLENAPIQRNKILISSPTLIKPSSDRTSTPLMDP